MTRTIIIREYISQKPNGDRDRERHDCSRFTVECNNFKVAEFDQFDDYHCHIDGSRRKYLNKAKSFASGLCIATGISADLEPIRETMSCPTCGRPMPEE